MKRILSRMVLNQATMGKWVRIRLVVLLFSLDCCRIRRHQCAYFEVRFLTESCWDSSSNFSNVPKTRIYLVVFAGIKTGECFDCPLTYGIFAVFGQQVAVALANPYRLEFFSTSGKFLSRFNVGRQITVLAASPRGKMF